MLIPGKKNKKLKKKSHKKPQNPKKQKTNQNLKIIAVSSSVFPSTNLKKKQKNNNYRIVVKNTVVCFFLLFPAIYLCHLYVTHMHKSSPNYI